MKVSEIHQESSKYSLQPSIVNSTGCVHSHASCAKHMFFFIIKIILSCGLWNTTFAYYNCLLQMNSDIFQFLPNSNMNVVLVFTPVVFESCTFLLISRQYIRNFIISYRILKERNLNKQTHGNIDILRTFCNMLLSKAGGNVNQHVSGQVSENHYGPLL